MTIKFYAEFRKLATCCYIYAISCKDELLKELIFFIFTSIRMSVLYLLCVTSFFSMLSAKEVLREVLVKGQMVMDFSLYVPSQL
jgi:hypothetical protein